MDLTSPLLGGEPDLDLDNVRYEDGSVVAETSLSAVASSFFASLAGKPTAACLRRAVENADVVQVHALLTARADVSAHHGEALGLAVKMEHWPLVAIMADHGGELTEEESSNSVTAVLRRIHAQDGPGLELLLRIGADANARDRFGATPLLWAVAYGSLHAVQMLLSYGADVSMKDGRGVGAVAAAAFHGDLEILHAVLLAKGHVDAMDRMRQTPLFLAATEGHLPIVEQLLFHKANVRHRSKWGGDSLYCACEGNHRPVIAALLNGNALVNEASPSGGETALHVACSRGHANAAQLLLAFHADPSARTRAGALPRDKASASPNVLEVLRAASSSAAPGEQLSPASSATPGDAQVLPVAVDVQDRQRLKVKVVDITGQERVRLDVPALADAASLLAYIEVPAGAKATLALEGQVLHESAQLAPSGVKDGDVLTLVLLPDTVSADLCGTWRRQDQTCWGCAWHEKHDTYVLHPTGEVAYEAVDNYDDGEDPTYVSVKGRGKWSLKGDGTMIIECTVEKTESTSYFVVTRTEPLELRTNLQKFSKEFKRIKPAQ